MVMTKTVSTHIFLRLIKISGVIISLFSIYFIIRDLFIHFIRRIGLSKERVISAALLLGVVFNLLGLLVFIKVKDGKMSFTFLDTIREYIIGYNPFSGELGLLKFFIFFTALAIISIFSFNRCKTYLE
jgi:hypothetical protein